MTVESVTYIDDLDDTYPAESETGTLHEGNNHIRNIKTGLLNTFPNVAGAVTASHTQLNKVTSGYVLKGITSYTSGSGTYTVPAGVTALYVELYGGGGGGGGVDGQGTGTAAASGGGGGGAYCAKLITGTLESSYSYAVGAGGAGGTAGANNGSTGGTSTFSGGSVNMGAIGGGGGWGCLAGAVVAAVPGVGGTASGGDVNITGGVGPYSSVYNAYYASLSLGGAGAGPLGGQTCFWNGGTGYVGNLYGGGGGPVVVDQTTTADYAGGAGCAGLVRITEYY
jgi:hypothetical protein